jgi:hypothetical protein
MTMPLVQLQRPVYYDKVYRVKPGGTEIPAQFCDRLPRDAVLLSSAPPVEIPEMPTKPVALSQLVKPSKPKKGTLSDLSDADETARDVSSED